MALFTVETAAEMGKRSAEARAQRKAELRLAVVPAAPVPLPTDDSYTSARLYLTREDIALVRDKLKENLDDPAAVDRYASAIYKLSEIEQKLAGRPNPGSLKPSQPKARTKPTSTVLELAPEPQPVVVKPVEPSTGTVPTSTIDSEPSI